MVFVLHSTECRMLFQLNFNLSIKPKIQVDRNSTVFELEMFYCLYKMNSIQQENVPAVTIMTPPFLYKNGQVKSDYAAESDSYI